MLIGLILANIRVMDDLYLISTPIKINKDRNWYLFHFKGVYQGKVIKEVAVFASDGNFKKGEEYLLHLKAKSLKGDRLITHLLEALNLKDLAVNF